MIEKTAGSGRTSVVSEQVVLEGEIHGEENLHVFGRIRGSIRIDGDFLVGRTGVVEADVEAANITVEGTIRGTVLAREHLEIQSSGTMSGDIAARSIDIKEGSSFEGRSRMLRQPAPQPTVAKSPTATEPPEQSNAAASEVPEEAPPKSEAGGEA
jgi:cytoskeletal protein CcmA (bactofilin family)